MGGHKLNYIHENSRTVHTLVPVFFLKKGYFYRLFILIFSGFVSLQGSKILDLAFLFVYGFYFYITS